MENNEVMNAEETKGFFAAAGEGICNAPREAKILLGGGALLGGLFIGITSFFVGKHVGRKEIADEMNPNNKKNNQNTQQTAETNNKQTAEQTTTEKTEQTVEQPQQQAEQK